MKLLIDLKNILCKTLEWLVILSVAIMVLILVWQIIVGNLGKLITIPNYLSTWTKDGATALLVWSSLFGAAVGFARKSHLGIDFFVDKLDDDSKTIAAIFSHSIVIAFVAYVFIWGGFKLFHTTDELMAGFQSAGWDLNLAYVYLAIPISGCFMLLFAIENLLEVFMGKSDSSSEKEVM